MPRPSAVHALPPTSARSRVGTGRTLFLEGVDGRSLLARRYREVLAELLADIGEPSAAQILIARRAATLSVWAEDTEARLIAGQSIEIGAFTTAANTMRRLLADLPNQREPKDITPKGQGTIIVEFVRAPEWDDRIEKPTNEVQDA